MTEDRHGGWRPYRPWRQNHLESGFDIIHPGTGGPSSLFMTGNSWTKHYKNITNSKPCFARCCVTQPVRRHWILQRATDTPDNLISKATGQIFADFEIVKNIGPELFKLSEQQQFPCNRCCSHVKKSLLRLLPSKFKVQSIFTKFIASSPQFIVVANH